MKKICFKNWGGLNHLGDVGVEVVNGVQGGYRTPEMGGKIDNKISVKNVILK